MRLEDYLLAHMREEAVAIMEQEMVEAMRWRLEGDFIETLFIKSVLDYCAT